jgi:phosphoribosylanthranilate isomerase
MVRVKICGLTNRDDALLAVKSGADAVGIVNVRASKRFVDLNKAKKIFSTLPVFVSKIVVATPKNVGEALEIEETGADYIQLHGNESLDFVRELRVKTGLGIIKKITVDGSSPENSRRYSEIVDAILLDTEVEGVLGGTGKIHDWDMSKEIVESLEKPVILAGGLNPGNVEIAIEKVNPYAVDVSSGVESTPGRKDKKKIEQFITNARK